MANGKGTISCHYCKHFAFKPVEWCGLYNIALPTDAIGTSNPICPDFAESKDSSVQFGMLGQLAELLPKMRRGFLYGFPYPSHSRLEDLREIAKLSAYA
jgi:hypothetical protein